MPNREVAEFKTIDGCILRGYLYLAKEKGPGVVLCPGFNNVKEMDGFLETAELLQKKGVSVLLYDPRSIGQSEGEPRNDINPYQQVEDFSDALTHLIAQPKIDPSQVGLWGMSLSGAVALGTAAFDKRVKFVVALCPPPEYRYDHAKVQQVLGTCFKDRVSRTKGNQPFYIPVLNASGENPAGFDFGLDTKRAALYVQKGMELAPGHVNQTTIQTYHKMMMWNPTALWKHLFDTPVLYVVPDSDQLCPREVQIREFERLNTPKRLHIVPQSGHLDILDGVRVSELHEVQMEFLDEYCGVGGRDQWV